MPKKENSSLKEILAKKDGFMAGGGEMGERTRAYDWSKSSLGPVSSWPQSLRTTISIILNARFPMFLWWGEDLIQFYNDAYRPSLGNKGKHPKALGQRGEECWPEIWPVIKPMIDQVRSGGEATWSEDQLIPIYRNGKMEDVYWTFGYSPVNDESGKVGGVLVICNETTDKVKKVKELELSDHRFQNLVREATVGMVVLSGEEMRVEVVNDTYSRLINRTSEEIMGKPLFSIIPETEDPFRPMLEKVLLTGEPLNLYDYPYFVYTDGDKREGYLNVVYQPYKEPDGRITGVMALCHDVTEQVRDRKKIEQSEQQIRSFVESASFPIGVYTGREMRIQFANQAILDVWGKGNDVIGKLYAEVLPELSNQEIFEQLDRVFTTGIPFHAKNQRVDLEVDGKLVHYYFNYSFTPLYDSEGKVYGVMNTAADITDLAIARKNIEESELFARSVIENSPVAQVVFIGEEMKLSMVNEKMLKILGRDKSILGKPFLEAIPEFRNTQLMNRLKLVFNTGETYYQPEERLEIIRYGQPYTGYYNYTYQALTNTSGEIYSVICTGLEVTEQVEARKKIEQAEAQTRSSAERLQLALDAGRLGSYELMLESGVIHCTPLCKQNFGLSEDDPFNYEKLISLILPADRDSMQRAVEKAITENSTYNAEYRVKWPESSIHWIKASGKVIYDELNKPIKIIGVTLDISEHKNFTEALELKNDQLMRINNDLDNFIYTASHDLKSPISNIEGLLQALMRNLSPEALESNLVQRISGMMQESVERFKRTIANLTDVVRLQKENSSDAVMVNLSQVIEEIILDLDTMIQDSGAWVELDIKDCRVIRFSEKNLRSVVYNLLSNAIKYCSPERTPQILIQCKRIDEYDLLSVQDNGLGMENKRMNQLFTMFKRFHVHVEGTGIGLYMVKKMVENAGGKIEVESQLGVGTRFLIYFPH
ncbi:PAS domain-containing protein [Catalinimonas niigatensis]|uniref:PAS domain-containing protein n=1 Tax=Catalinimonas niigatensis TaxID=1397264 RepID=UPI002665036F|nr:PAS domain-containing protein [Catalinimonas niigatensis]WPP50302.1 PAS domain-containing protein [Catalinimonas niigatensis]